MKKILLILVAFISFQTLSSCREDGKWGNDNGGQFGFTIERDNDFIEKAIGETNQLKFNIKPSYDFGSVSTTFKFTTDLNGVLSLNGKVLTANKEYQFEGKNNIFEYVGNVSGTHKLKISVKNDKGASNEEAFELKYSVSEFAHTYTGGSGPIYQGEDTQYLMKIVPGSGQPNTGYEIKFNTYSGKIKLNGVVVVVDKFYSLQNIDNFNLTLTSDKSGNGGLFYTIKNATVSKDYTIQQDILAKSITVESLNISKSEVAPNTALSLVGVIKKSPTTANSSVQYKTWISSASNNNTGGIQNTGNAYVSYGLGSNGGFNYSFSALEAGSYDYNIQFKDEFGNESEVKTYTIKVENALAITTPPTVSINLQRTANAISGGNFDIRHRYNGAILNVAAKTTGNNGISKIVFELNFIYDGQNITKSYTYNYNDFPKEVNLNSTNTNDGYQLNSFIGYSNSNQINASNGTFKVFVYDKNNKLVSKSGTAVVNIL